MTGYSETRRQFVHIAMAGFALLLRYLTWPQAALLAATALVFNAFLLARVAPAIIRPTDRAHRAGVIFYPLSVLLLILAFRDRLDLAAAAWGILAFGDGAATLAGQSIGGARLPWNREKTRAGLIAFVIAGFIGGSALFWWVGRGEMITGRDVIAIGLSTSAAAFVETIPIALDDNLSVPFAAGFALAFFFAIRSSGLERFATLLGDRWVLAVGANLAMASIAWMRGSLTLTGAIVGTVLGVVIFVATGWEGWALLFLAFAVAVVGSRLGRARKLARGIAEPDGDRRGAGNAIANCLVGTIGAAWSVLTFDMEGGLVVFVTALVAGASDTVASEFGKAFGGTTRVFPSLAIAPPGTPGAISTVGTIAGIVAAFLMAVIADHLLGTRFHPAVVIGATAGSFAESALATQFESRGILNNDVLNFLNTLVAAGVAILVWRAMAAL